MIAVVTIPVGILSMKGAERMWDLLATAMLVLLFPEDVADVVVVRVVIELPDILDEGGMVESVVFS